MQIENEYGAFGYDDFPRDTAYLESLKDALGQFGIESLLFTSDSPKGTQDFGSIPGGIHILSMDVIYFFRICRHA